MKVKVIENKDCLDDEVTIICKQKDSNIQEIVQFIENYGVNIAVKLNNEKLFIPLNDVFYFEAVDNKVFVYTEKKVYEINYKLTQILEKIANQSFIQVSRTVILNINKIDRVSSLINGRILAILNNKEKIIITRAYANMFKSIITKKGEN